MFFSYCSILLLRHWHIKSMSSQTFRNFKHSWGFAFINVSKFGSKKVLLSLETPCFSPCDQGHISITLGTKCCLYQKLFEVIWRYWNVKMKHTNGQSSKSRWKKWGHLSVYHFYSRSYGHDNVKYGSSLVFFADDSKA